MEKLVLIRSEDIGYRYYLSVLCGPHLSPKENIRLPVYDTGESYIPLKGNSCRGLMYFDDFEGNIILCNLTTKEWKPLQPETDNSVYSDGCFCCPDTSSSGLGYDSKSQDYKLIKTNYPYSEKIELYSLKSDSWKEIPSPGDDICGGYTDRGAYLGAEGRCYWRTLVRGGPDVVLSFDFTNETFSRLPLPQAPEVKDFVYEFFECDGFLAAVGFVDGEESSDDGGGVGKYFELWLWREGSWAKLFVVTLVDGGRPLGLRDGRFMYLEGRSSCKDKHLMVYDWVKEELREYDIYDMRDVMWLLPYVENRVMLPDAKSLIDGVERPIEKVLKKCRCRQEMAAKRSRRSTCERSRIDM